MEIYEIHFANPSFFEGPGREFAEQARRERIAHGNAARLLKL